MNILLRAPSFTRRAKIVILYLAAAHLSTAATYYVATNGSDSNAGTVTAPFATVSKGASIAVAGDTVYVRGGTYRQRVTMSKSGTSAAPITIAGYPGETAIIDGNNMTIPAQNGGGGLIMGSGISNITIQNLTVANSGYQGISIQGTNIVVDHVTAYGNWAAAVELWGSYLTISNNISHDNVQQNLNGRSGGQYDNTLYCGIYSGAVTDHCTMTGNSVWNNWGDGISLVNATQSTMTGNVSYNNWQEQIYIQNVTYTLVNGNLSYVTAGNSLSGTGGPQHNIHIGDESGKSNTCRNLTIVNNFAMGGRTVLLLSPSGEAGSGVISNVIANNTLVNASASNGVSAIYINSSSYNSGSFIENNIIEQDDSLAIFTIGVSSGITFSHNLWSKSPSGGLGTGDIVSDPKLAKTGSTAPGSLPPDWFKLTAGSPAIGQGVVLSQVTDDFFKTPRGQTNDIGGNQYGGGSSSAGDASAPAVPTGLAITSTTSSAVSLQWSASTDNVGVTGYKVYRNGAVLAPSVGGTTFQDIGLTASTTYYYSVAAYDAAGNVSAPSGQVPATTGAAADAIAPSVPANVAITGVTSSSISLQWNASTDNVKVAGYKVYRNGVVIVPSVVGTTFQDTGLQASTTFNYSVAAYDAAGNVSAPSSPVAGTTSAPTVSLSVLITTPGNGAVIPLGTAISMTGKATDSTAISGMVWTVDGVVVRRSSMTTSSTGATSEATWTPRSSQGWSPGYYVIGLAATDAAGNTARSSITIRLQ